MLPSFTLPVTDSFHLLQNRSENRPSGVPKVHAG